MVPVKLLGSFLLSYPLAAALKNIPDAKPYQKNLFVIAYEALGRRKLEAVLMILSVSMFYLIGLFDLYTGLRTILISSVGAYAIASFIDSPFMPWIGFVFLMGHMSLSHIERQALGAPETVDVTGTS